VIIESIFSWLLNVLTSAIDLLPANGAMFASVKNVSFSIFGFMTLLDGYIPMKEFLSIALIIMAVSLAMGSIRVIFGIFNLITKVKP